MYTSTTNHSLIFLFLSFYCFCYIVEKLTLRNCQSAFSSKHVPVGGYTDDLRHAGDKINVGNDASNYLGGAIVIRNSGPSLIDMALVGNRANYGGSIAIDSRSQAVLRPLLSNVDIKDSHAQVRGSAIYATLACFDWIGGEISGCDNNPVILNVVSSSCTAGIRFQDLVVTNNIDATQYSGAFIFFEIFSTVTVQNVMFQNNAAKHARDIYIYSSKTRASIQLINNIHLPSTPPSNLPPVLNILYSCDEVAGGYRGFVNGEDTPKTYWLIDPTDAHKLVETRCSFVPKGGLTQLSTVINDPLNFKVDGWNVIARRQWQDGNGFDKNWDEYSEGFSTPNKKGFWLGNKYVSKWTNARDYSLLVHFCKCDIFLTFNYTYSYLSLQMNALVFD